MTYIKIIGMGDSRTVALKENLQAALLAYPIKAEIKEVSEVNTVFSSGISETPALIINGEIASEGAVPSPKEIETILRNRALLKSKLAHIHRILVPVDYEPASKAAYVYACEIAAVWGASVEVLYAFDGIFDGGRAAASGLIDNIKKTIHLELAEFAAEMKGQLREAIRSVSVTTRVYAGYPEVGIIERSAEVDLIVMGSTAKKGLPSWIFGSTGASVLKNAHCPVLLIHEKTKYAGLDAVVYASHFESLNSLKVKEAVTFTEKFGGHLHFIHIGPEGEKGVGLEQKLFEIQYGFAQTDKPFTFDRLLGKDIPELLNTYAIDHKIDLVIFVTGHRNFWEDLWHKSASKAMLMNSDLPLLVLHEKE